MPYRVGYGVFSISNYRQIEKAKSNRSYCRASLCGHKKIGKGELRVGTFVVIAQIQSWQWRHFGCVSEKQLSNMKESLGEDLMSSLDGIEDLEKPLQDKIITAIKKGSLEEDDKSQPDPNSPHSKRLEREREKEESLRILQESEDAEKEDGLELPKKRLKFDNNESKENKQNLHSAKGSKKKNVKSEPETISTSEKPESKQDGLGSSKTKKKIKSDKSVPESSQKSKTRDERIEPPKLRRSQRNRTAK